MHGSLGTERIRLAIPYTTPSISTFAIRPSTMAHFRSRRSIASFVRSTELKLMNATFGISVTDLPSGRQTAGPSALSFCCLVFPALQAGLGKPMDLRPDAGNHQTRVEFIVRARRRGSGVFSVALGGVPTVHCRSWGHRKDSRPRQCATPSMRAEHRPVAYCVCDSRLRNRTSQFDEVAPGPEYY